MASDKQDERSGGLKLINEKQALNH